MQKSKQDNRDIILYAVIAIVFLAVCSLLGLLFGERIMPWSNPVITEVTVDATTNPSPASTLTPEETTLTPGITDIPTDEDAPTGEPTEAPPNETLTTSNSITDIVAGDWPTVETTEETPTTEPPESPTPTPITGIVNIGALNVRVLPSADCRMVGGAYENQELIVLSQARSGTWLEIVTLNNRRGWVNAKYIDEVELDEVPINTRSDSSSCEATTTTEVTQIDIESNTLVENRTIPGEIRQFDDAWFVFTENDIETVIVFMYRPNLAGIQFQVFEDDRIPDNSLPSGNPDNIPNIGAGSKPDEDRDGDLNTGELLWRSGGLIVGSDYYIWFSNPTNQPIEYCIIPGDVREWICDP